MFKKILLILSSILLCSCSSNGLNKTGEALYDIEDITFTMVDHDVTIDNHNSTYLIGFDYKVGNAYNQIEDSIILRPNESYTISLDVNPSIYSTTDLTYYKFDYTVEYETLYADDTVMVFIDEDDYSLVKEIVENEIELSKIVNRYNQTYKFSFGYYAYYNEENNSYDIYYKDTFVKSLTL